MADSQHEGDSSNSDFYLDMKSGKEPETREEPEGTPIDLPSVQQSNSGSETSPNVGSEKMSETENASFMPELMRNTKIAIKTVIGDDKDLEPLADSRDENSADTDQSAENVISFEASEGTNEENNEADETTIVNEVQDPNKRNSQSSAGVGSSEEECEGSDLSLSRSLENRDTGDAPVDDAAEPIPEVDQTTKNIKKKDDEERFEDVCRKVLSRFSTIDEFFKFARSKKGLNMDDAIIDDCKYDNPTDINEVKTIILEKWKGKNKSSDPCQEIREIVVKYFNTYTENPTASNKSGAQKDAASEIQGATAAPRFEDVFQDEIIPAFADVGEFRQFARSGNGLKLDAPTVRQIMSDHPLRSHEQMMEMLKAWKQRNKDATPELIIKIKDNYPG